jgi:hypothetical protein
MKKQYFAPDMQFISAISTSPLADSTMGVYTEKETGMTVLSKRDNPFKPLIDEEEEVDDEVD